MIRKFEDNDIDDIMQIWKSAKIKAHNFISNEYWENNYKYVKSILPNAELYVYLVNNKIIGFIGMNTNYIEGIFVDTNSQHNGIGTLLLNKVKENRNNLILRVYKKNTNAINFYKKNDFIITNEDIDPYTGFKYYEFVKANDEREFNTFLNKCKELSFYNTENSAVYGDKLLTLSTCEYSTKNGRLVIIAKKINNTIPKTSEENITKEEITTNNTIESSKVIEKQRKEEKSEKTNKLTEEKNTPEVSAIQTSNYDENAFANGHLKSFPSFASNYATLKINKIGVNAPVYLGATDELLLKGVVHDTGSYFCGENGTIIMCGHNYMNNFKRLRRVKKQRYYRS